MADDGSSLPHPTATETSETEQDPWIGRTLASYRLIRRIGWGGMGVVYQAQHPSLERYAAVKFLAANLAMDKTYIDMFLREAKAAAKLNHPNIIAIYDCGSVGQDVYYLIMEYVEGRDLRSMLRDQLVLPVAEAIHYIRQVCSGLAYAHRKKIIHRDIKPENLMLTDEGVIKIGDLGLAKWMGDDSGALTQTGLVMGSPFYIAPERLRGDPDVNETTDVYSLGGTFFHLLTGKVPYEGTAPVVMAKHLDSPVPNPLDVNPSLDSRLCEIVMKMMSKDQKSRYQNMQEVDADLADYERSLSHPVMRAIPQKEQSSTTLPIPEDLAKAGVVLADPKSVAAAEPPQAATKKFPVPAGVLAGATALVCAALVWAFWPAPATQTSEPPPSLERDFESTSAVAPTPEPKAEPKPVETAMNVPPSPPPKPAAVATAAKAPSAASRIGEPVLPAKPGHGQVVLMHDFEEGAEGWRIDWGYNMGGPTRSNDYAHSGKGGIVFRHNFFKGEEAAGAVVTYKTPKDLSAFKELRAQVYLPEGKSNLWELQMYVRTGPELATTWGRIYKAWRGEWHEVKFDLKNVKNPADIREIGLQVKNFAETKATIYYDQIEAVGR